MKKLTCLLLLVFACVGIFAGCGNNKNVIRVNEVTHSIFYAPFYVAIENGYFEEEGFEIKLENGQGSDASMSALIAKSADVILAGPETAVYVNKKESKVQPVIFGQLTKRDGSFLVSKTQIDNFTLDSLKGKEVLAGRPGGMPAMTLQYVLQNAGLTLADNTNNENVKYNLEYSFGEMAAVFAGSSGVGDYATFFEPLASQMVKDYGYQIVTGIGELCDEIPYTAFMTTSKYLKNNEERLEKFLRAVMKGYNFLYTATDAEIVAALKGQFPTTADDVIISSIERYKSIDAWKSSPQMTAESFDNLQNVLINAGTLSLPKVSFSSVVNNSIAERIVA